MEYRYLLFDLDGTLTDSAEGITKSVQYALNKMGIDEPDLLKLRPFIGPPLRDSFMKYYGMNIEEADTAIAWYRERYGKTGKFENAVYDGIPDLLAQLRAMGKVLVTASSKPEPYVREIMDHFALTGYFTEIVGASMDHSISTKDQVIREAFRRLDIREEEKNAVLMIGDRDQDVMGASRCGISCLGTYIGFAEPGELEEAGAVYIAHDIDEMQRLLVNM